MSGMDPAQAAKELITIRESARVEFEGIIDFSWKIPDFWTTHIKIELEKLDRYFPLSEDSGKNIFSERMRKLRWDQESHSLFAVFPHMISAGTLAACLSMFETYLYRICKTLEKFASLKLENVRGNGLGRLCTYIERALEDIKLSFTLHQVNYYREIRAAAKIRNAIIHTAGILEICRNAEEIRRIIDHKLYLDQRLSNTGGDLDNTEYLIIVEKGNFGDQISIGSLYIWRLSTYCRDFILTLLSKASVEISAFEP